MKNSAGNGLRFSARFSLMALAALAIVGVATAVRGQSALDGFDPNANGTVVVVVVVQPDGKILIGGDFTTLSPNGGAPVTRNRIARLNPDGTLDTVFNPNANGIVRSIALQADGKILVGGSFNGANSIGGQTRNRIARLDATTGLADSFDPNANGNVRSIAVQGDGKILVGGDFNGANSIGGQVRNYIARLDPTTGLTDSFDPNANNFVQSIAVQADGKILVGGGFNSANSIGGQTRNFIARLDATTGQADSFNPNAVGEVDVIAVQGDGKILAGGTFNGASSIGGQTRNRIARLDAMTGQADSFDPNANMFGVYTIAVEADGKILAGGDFTSLSPDGGGAVTRNHIARLETDGRLDRTLNLSAVGGQVNATAVQPDGKILIGGSFTTVLGVTRNNIARLNTDGTLDSVFNPNANGEVLSIAVQTDGKILEGGAFSSIGGQTRNYIARLDGTTGLADSFDPNADDIVFAIAVQADGKILVGGDFFGTNSIGGQTRNYIARLDGTTGLADSFDPNAGFAVVSIAVQADGKVIAGGAFPFIGGQVRSRIARLDAATGLADSFNPNANGIVRSIAVQADGKILAGGFFNGANSIGGGTRNYIARLDPTTGLTDTFDPNANAVVYSIMVQGDGKILAGGDFSSIGGQTRNHIARLDATTGLADTFDPNANGGTVLSIAVQADGKVLAGGDFTTIGGQTRNRFARLSNDTAALQNLAVTQTTITWIRGGSSPQFTRVTFESSTDNVTYTPLGNGMASGSNWTLTGLNLPTGQNFYIRARGYYHSGVNTGSESITESVRNAFLSVPLLTSAFSRKTHGGAGTFDIPLPLTGNVGVECRSGGATNDYQMIMNFASSVTVDSASVTSGTGSVSSFNVSGSQVTVNLTGVINVQRITVTLFNVNDGTHMGNVPISMGVLIGDVNGNAVVNASDVSLTKSQVGNAVSGSNFREDVNANGTISATDVAIVKSEVGTSLPP